MCCVLLYNTLTLQYTVYWYYYNECSHCHFTPHQAVAVCTFYFCSGNKWLNKQDQQRQQSRWPSLSNGNVVFFQTLVNTHITSWLMFMWHVINRKVMCLENYIHEIISFQLCHYLIWGGNVFIFMSSNSTPPLTPPLSSHHTNVCHIVKLKTLKVVKENVSFWGSSDVWSFGSHWSQSFLHFIQSSTLWTSRNNIFLP